LGFPVVWPVAHGTEDTRRAAMAGTWPGFVARYDLQQILAAVGYETQRVSLELPSARFPVPGPGIPYFLLAETSAGGLAGLFDALEETSYWTAGLVVVASSDPRAALWLTGGAVPDALRGKSSQDPVSVLDILPTLLDAAGTVAPSGSPGRSLWDHLHGSPAPVPEFAFTVLDQGDLAVRSPGWRLTWDGPVLPLLTEGLMALTQAAIDSGSFRLDRGDAEADVLTENRETAEKLKAAMVQWLVSGAQNQDGPPMDPRLQQALRSHGYW
jgi:hypothetical protein